MFKDIKYIHGDYAIYVGDGSTGRQVDRSTGRQVDRSTGRQVDRSTGSQVRTMKVIDMRHNDV